MKAAIPLLALLLTVAGTQSQPCFPEGITISTQGQINTFATYYPNCTQVQGDLVITGYNITNLQGLKQITAIGGSLRILCNEALASLSGLENLATIGGNLYLEGNLVLPDCQGLNGLHYLGLDLQCTDNPALTSLAGLGGLTSVPGKLWIDDNDALVSLAGLNNLVSVGGMVRIISNDALVSLSGLDNLAAVGGNLAIGGLGHLGPLGNASLVSLSGLSNLAVVGGRLEVAYNASLPSLDGLDNIVSNTVTEMYINNNPQLSECEVASVCGFLAAPGGTVVIHDNAEGCNSIWEVTEACLLIGTSEKVAQEKILLFPNPARERITVRIPAGMTGGLLTLTDASGREVLRNAVSGPEASLDLAGLRPGIYLVSVSGGSVGWHARVAVRP